MFREELNQYLSQLNCSGRELARRAGLSEATVSRYRGGVRQPSSEELERLCRAVAELAAEQGMTELSLEEVTERLRPDESPSYPQLQSRLNRLFALFGVNVSEVSRTLRYDSSYLSRIRSGHLRPLTPITGFRPTIQKAFVTFRLLSTRGNGR